MANRWSKLHPGLGPNLTANILLQFLQASGNILVALSSDTAASTTLVSLLGELEITLPADRTGLVVDHFDYDALSAGDLHDVVLVEPPVALRPDVSSLFSGEAGDKLLAFPRGVGQTLGNGPLVAPVVRAPRTAYSYNPKEQGEAVDAADLFAAGAQLSLVSALQARNSARLVVVGAAELLADKWFGAKVKKAGDGNKQVATYNREFAKRLSGWAFQETGVLRVNWVEHRLDGQSAANATNPKIYRIKNDVVRFPPFPSSPRIFFFFFVYLLFVMTQTYSISLSEYAWDRWTPFAVPAGDELQLEFSMLSPFHRLGLRPVAAQPSNEATVYSVSFRLPDQHGIFNFLVDYKRPFLSNVEEKNTVSVRHMAHDEWPRSFVISGAWPWIAGIGATVAGWLAFCAVWMYSAPVGSVSKEKKTQ